MARNVTVSLGAPLFRVRAHQQRGGIVRHFID